MIVLSDLEIATIRKILSSSPSDGWSQLSRSELELKAEGMNYDESKSFATKCLALGIGDDENEIMD